MLSIVLLTWVDIFGLTVVQFGMHKSEAIELLGGSISAAADAIGVSYQAIDKWPDVLPARIADRVQAALWRMQQAQPITQPQEVA